MKPTERKNMMTFELINKWIEHAKKGEKVMYYKGFFSEDSKNKYEFRKFSEDLLNFERKTRSFILYQKITKNQQKKNVIIKFIELFDLVFPAFM